MHAVLALETSTPVCSVALKTGDKITSRSAVGTGIHSEHTFLFVQELLEHAGLQVHQLDAIVVSGGPGSYTGLRIASSAVKGMLFSGNTPLFAADTLASIAVSRLMSLKDGRSKRLHAVLNARRTHLYHQTFLLNPQTGLQPICNASVRGLASIEGMFEQGDIVAGTGIGRLSADALAGYKIIQLENEDALRAESLIEMVLNPVYSAWVKTEDPQFFEPLYGLEEEA
ncbi:MAG: tRNA (adenosine(37)-N6)-threonylcarbamoyltransferase complex dimerization subunit type 1 TsaB [Candidatus Cyclonatronum sp.]|uniref:tRNA (adenosine(37)-N6)-threonylcarbamoyltransferase complex dimerization subunit type 1 TsaB n=1 Tax=Cyclonatronum sp. TaxID=3024185 RepID=UPI0025C27039|nr:tRNA (adenosine(37)-N6)-threonylcarbamoyltransferase complex dimerization subunit type 1 TsaB [Cyclonatronum sp.]MCC5933446.1 tRNA (adenosine(37)-N6)-threonylcarbamoyltransferase complex dimerization subunit type 1 TsaB [Balneolales bacterium]MCH8485783.1 tRNA (adenosine(37)-N6)-threonylcarbamoyltransferase complex dimerization subunit type 1 TsaB [Cyclonatronum sp.]